jgi:hypothetical protein
MNTITNSTKCKNTEIPYFKVKLDNKGNQELSLIISEKSFIVRYLRIDRNSYVFTLHQVSKNIIIDGLIKGIDINGDNIYILSLPITLLKKLGCMKSTY